MAHSWSVTQIGIVALLLSPITYSHGQTTELRDAEILPTAIDAIVGNYEKLTTIRAKLYTVHLDSEVDKEQVRTFEVKGGDRITFTEAPRTARRVYFTSKGQDYRYEHRGQAVYICKDGTLTQHSFATSRTRSWPLSKSPGLVEMDPRTLGGRDVRYGLLSQIKESQLISADFRDDGIVEIATLSKVAAKRGQTTATHCYTLDRNRSWLPTRVVALRADGLIANVKDFEYDEVLPKTWFMKQVTTNYAGRYEIREISSDVQWSQTHLVYTFGQPEFNVPVSDAELTLLRPITIEEIENSNVR